MESAPTNRQKASIPLSFSLLGRKIEDLFIQQYGRIAFHYNDEANDYRVEERRLSALMLDKTISNEERLDHARAIIKLSDTYQQSFVQRLLDLNKEIERELLGFKQLLNSAQQSGDSENEIPLLQRWLSLSQELHEVRLIATTSGIVNNVAGDKWIPNIIIKNDGRVDMRLNASDQEQLKMRAADSVVLKEAIEREGQIQLQRGALTGQLLFLADENAMGTAQPAVTPRPTAKSVHPLEARAWFRLVKVAYIASWIVGLGIALLIGLAENDMWLPVGLAGALAVGLILLKKAFYYVILGRTTATEKPGRGFMDLEDFQHDLAAVRASSPDVYERVVAPFLVSWKQQYGRRIPLHAVDHLKQRIDEEMSQIKRKKQEILDKATEKGATIDIEQLRARMENTKAEYRGDDRVAFNRAVDQFIMSLEAKYGAAIPVAEASALADQLDEDMRKDTEAGRSGAQTVSSPPSGPERPDYYAGTKSHWSSSPGSFERQLQRREGNAMFPQALREPTNEDIQTARAHDERDFKAAEEAATGWIKGVQALLEKGPTVGTMAPYHKSSDDVMRLCAIAGAPAEGYRLKVKRIDSSIGTEIIRAMEMRSPEDAAKCREGDESWVALRNITSHPLFAQLAREGGPISANEQVPTILCESLETVNEIVAIVCAAKIPVAKSWYRQALDLMLKAKEAGFRIPAIEEKLALLTKI